VARSTIESFMRGELPNSFKHYCYCMKSEKKKQNVMAALFFWKTMITKQSMGLPK